jgi:RHS repeat-associated protein
MPSLPEETINYDFNAVNQLLSVTNPSLTFVYDDDGNMTHGYVNPLLGGAGVGYPFTATYDAEDRMTSLEYTDSSSVVHRTEYRYSGDGFLAIIRKFENSSLVDEIRIVRDGFLAIQDRDENNAVVREYTWGLNLGGGIGGLLNLKQGGQDYSYLYDGKGNVAAVLDGSQAVVAAYRYAPFGKLLAKTGSLTQPFGFSTKRYDAQTGLIYYGYRFYGPEIGRWTTRDPFGEAGGMNLYAFVGNNPFNWVDPFGLREYFDLGSGWTGGMDVFNTGGRALHEIHVFNNVGKEIGIFGPTGWINKHGFTGAPQNIPQNVYNRLNGINVNQLRKEGLLPLKGRMNIKGGRYMNVLSKTLCIAGFVISVLDMMDAQSGKTSIFVHNVRIDGER